MTPETDPATAAPQTRKPRFAFFFATALGLGYLRPAPGTWGSLAGLALALFFAIRNDWILFGRWPVSSEMARQFLLVLFSFVGVWAAARVAKHCGKADPQCVVIDEVSGQWLMLMLGSAHAFVSHPSTGTSLVRCPASFFGAVPLNWKYLLLGFILFRGFDIWKPFPIRRRSGYRAVGGSWRTTGSPPFTPRRGSGSRAGWVSDEFDSLLRLRACGCGAIRVLPTPSQHQS